MTTFEGQEMKYGCGKPAFDLTGNRFNRFVVMGRSGTNRHGHPVWECRCDCGAIRHTTGSNLIRGQHKSCGCLSRELTAERSIRHGHTRLKGMTPEYRAWSAMTQRCINPKSPGFRHCGARGIKVCERWCNSFEAFFADVGSKPSSRFLLSRINNDGNYEPGNCRWIMRSEQNRRRQKKQPPDVMRMTRFPAGTFTRIAAALWQEGDRKEQRTDFVRLAVERELERREREAPKKQCRGS
jgi:hypothetical protein